MPIKRAVAAALAVVAMSLIAIVAAGGGPWLNLLIPDNAVYYRVKVGLSHKGEPIDFDVVVGCGARVGSDGYSGASIDILSWYPFVYAKEIPGGHAVLLRTTVDGSARLGEEPCRGGTSTDGSGNYRTPNAPGVAADWLPILVWYEHADDLSHGLAYVTQDAYESPDAELEFHGATIEHATKIDFVRFLATAPKNLVPRYLAQNLCCEIPGSYKTPAAVPQEVVRNPTLAWTKMVRPYCYGAERIRLDEAQRVRVRALWPVDHPRFWSVPGDDQYALSVSLFAEGGKERPQPAQQILYRYVMPDTPEGKAGREQVFPLVSALALNRLDKDTGLSGYVNEIQISDGQSQRGMMACDSEASAALEQAVTGRVPIRRRVVLRQCQINGVTVPSPRSGGCEGSGGYFIAFENDEYLITSWGLTQIAL